MLLETSSVDDLRVPKYRESLGVLDAVLSGDTAGFRIADVVHADDYDCPRVEVVVPLPLAPGGGVLPAKAEVSVDLELLGVPLHPVLANPLAQITPVGEEARAPDVVVDDGRRFGRVRDYGRWYRGRNTRTVADEVELALFSIVFDDRCVIFLTGWVGVIRTELLN